MVIDMSDKLHYIDKGNPTYLGELPDTCPVCTYAVSPEYIFTYKKDRNTTELLCVCPRYKCGALFIVVYEGWNNYELIRCYPSSKFNKKFPEEVSDLFPNFVAIFNQAHHAEQEGLDLICGVA
ncbi:hypothetical protein [Priestia endophytica]|uniref:hypothetical protein n=1 Tax=Priestia endophytica TaxID=135735 RepID=UPI001F54E8DB|nr:hypothetical protein [Priestia endophytica]